MVSFSRRLCLCQTLDGRPPLLPRMGIDDIDVFFFDSNAMIIMIEIFNTTGYGEGDQEREREIGGVVGV